MKTLIFGILAVFLLSSCPVPEAKTVEKPVDSLEIMRNRNPIPPNANGNPAFEIMEEKSVFLSAKLVPDVRAGVHWQSSRPIVDLSDFSGQEIVLFARYGGDTHITVRAANVLNEVPLFETVHVKVIPTSYYKWQYALDGWKDLPPAKSATVDRIYNKALMLSGNSPVNEDAVRGGLVLEGPGTLVVGSVMPVPTNSVYTEDPAMDDTAQFNFTKKPSDTSTAAAAFPFNLKIRVSVEYEVLVEPAYRQGLRLQVNNNTAERDNASVFTNWLVAEYTAGMPRSGTLTGVFDTDAASIDPNLAQEKRDTIPAFPAIAWSGDTNNPILLDTPAQIAEKQLRGALSHSFVCLALPDGKVLIRGIRIELDN
jgi:hypothetical protein